jgi:cytochrome P450
MADFHLLVHTWRRLLPHAVPQPVRRRMRQGGRVVDDILMDIIRQKRAAGASGDDLLSLLLAARDDAGTGMSDAQLRDEAATLFLAGHETTALALGYAFVALAGDPAVRDWLHEELDDVLGDRLPGADDVPRLVRTGAVVDETMRLYPPAWIIGREPQTDVTLGGYRVSRGEQVLMSPWALHRDPRWFADPLAFRPARWLDGLADRLPRFAYLPFGGGPRVCIGNHFARMEAVLVLATIARRVRLDTAPGFRLRLAPAVTLRPAGGLPVVVRRR